VWAPNAGGKEGGAVANIPPSEIVVPISKAEDGEEGKDDGVCCPGSVEDSCMEVRGGGGNVFCDHIIRGMMVAAAAAPLLLLQLPQQPGQLRPLTGAGQRRTTSMMMQGGGGG
jgi:hypothetical protein